MSKKIPVCRKIGKIEGGREWDMRKGVSEYKMSFVLGHSRGYVNNISSGKALPSMSEFFAICEYFSITPREFFNADMCSPTAVRETFAELETLEEEDLELIQRLAKRLRRGKTAQT